MRTIYSAFPDMLILVALTVPHSWAPFVHFSAQSSFQVEHHLPMAVVRKVFLMLTVGISVVIPTCIY